MIIERLLFNKSGYYYGLYTLVSNENLYKWKYVSGSMTWNEDYKDKYISIYINEKDGHYINFREDHLNGDS